MNQLPLNQKNNYLSRLVKRETFNTDFGYEEFYSPDIIVYRFTVDRITLDLAREVSVFRSQLIGDNVKYYAVSDLSDGIVTVSKEAKEYIASDPKTKENRFFDVVIVSNWAIKMEASLYKRFNKPHVETRIVTSLDKALEMIESHKLKLVEG